MDGVYLLDREMDADHNRCVITLVGEREAIQEAAIRGVGKAAELIDLNQHQGAHPRMGAADVVPFIPIDGVTIEDCVAMARHVGERDLEALSDSGLSVRGGGGYAGAAESGKHSAGAVRGHSGGHCDQSGAQAGFWRVAGASDGGGDGGGRAQVSDRLQRFSEHAGCRDREEDCQGGALLERRIAVCERRGISGARAGAGFDEPD